MIPINIAGEYSGSNSDKSFIDNYPTLTYVNDTGVDARLDVLVKRQSAQHRDLSIGEYIV